MTDERIDTLPLDNWHRARGARMVAFAGYSMPIHYDGIVAEHLWTRENAGLFDVSHMGQILLSGPDAARALEAIVPGDMAGIGPNRVRYTLLLDEHGGILDDLMVTNRDGSLYLVVNGATKYEDLGYLREQLDDAITISQIDAALIALQGPKAVTALQRLLPGVEQLYFMESARFQWNDSAVDVSRSGYTGEDGFEISLPTDDAEAFATAMCAYDEVKPIGLGARDSLRLEAGLPLYGHDLSPAVDPVEAELGFAIHKRRRADGGFVGAARILGHLAQGAAVKRVGFTVEGKLPVREGAGLFVRDAKVGTVTSGGFSPSLGYPVGMALIDAVYSASGTGLEADVRGRRVPVRIAAMPFVVHRYHRRGKAC